MNNTTDIIFPDVPGYMPPVHQVTTKEVIDQLLPQFVWRTELMAASFLLVMCYLEYYTWQLYKEQKKTGIRMKGRDAALCFISNVFFLASVAYALTFLSYLTGWF